ncbi:hypothetical protein HK405_004403 [Cladochytrium tenue]|nr:hypothetical protein HK405_004403 [Cladochytrium tenue]
MLRRIPATIGRSDPAIPGGIGESTGGHHGSARVGSPHLPFPDGFVLPPPPRLRPFLAPDAHPGGGEWIASRDWCPPWLRRRRSRAAMLDGDVDDDAATRDRTRVFERARERLEDRRLEQIMSVLDGQSSRSVGSIPDNWLPMSPERRMSQFYESGLFGDAPAARPGPIRFGTLRPDGSRNSSSPSPRPPHRQPLEAVATVPPVTTPATNSSRIRPSIASAAHDLGDSGGRIGTIVYTLQRLREIRGSLAEISRRVDRVPALAATASSFAVTPTAPVTADTAPLSLRQAANLSSTTGLPYPAISPAVHVPASTSSTPADRRQQLGAWTMYPLLSDFVVRSDAASRASSSATSADSPHGGSATSPQNARRSGTAADVAAATDPTDGSSVRVTAGSGAVGH